jgi:hypothetical protein
MGLDIQMVMEFASQDFAMSSHRHGESHKPTPAQYALEPGDTAFVLGSRSEVDNDLIITQVLMPDELADEFPDWEERFQKGYMLCRWYAYGDKEGDSGWFARSSLVPLPPVDFATVLGDFILGRELTGDNYNQDYPQMVRAYRLHNVQISTMRENAEHGAAPLLCEVCSSPMVHIRIERHMVGTYNSAYFNHNGEKKLLKAGEITENWDTDIKAVCEEEHCGHVQQLCENDLAMACNNPNHNH